MPAIFPMLSHSPLVTMLIKTCCQVLILVMVLTEQQVLTSPMYANHMLMVPFDWFGFSINKNVVAADESKNSNGNEKRYYAQGK